MVIVLMLDILVFLNLDILLKIFNFEYWHFAAFWPKVPKIRVRGMVYLPASPRENLSMNLIFSTENY